MMRMMEVMGGVDQQSGSPMNGPSAEANTSGNTSVVYIVRVAIYNVSEMENSLEGRDVDKMGSEKWNHTGTYGMMAAMKSMGVWEYNGKKYKFEPHILEYNEIANGTLEKGNYKLLLAPGDDDYFTDQGKQDGAGLKDAIRNFVENGGGYLGTCGGAEFACRHIKWKTAEGDIEDSGLITLGIIDAIAYNAPPYTGNSNYFYRGIMYDSGTPEEGNGSGVSDLGGIPMINVFKNPVGPFKNYRINQKINLRYWGGPWFDPGKNATGVAKYDREACENESILLHYRLDGRNVTINLSRYIGDKWSIIMQDSINGKGRIVLFGCHPEHKTWKWGSGKIIENDDYTQYIYAYPENASSWQKIKEPPVETYDIVQEAAKWIVEPVLHNITETWIEDENNNADDENIHFSFPDALMDGDNYIPYTPHQPSPDNNSINISTNATLSFLSGDFGGDKVEYYLTIREINSTNSTTIHIDHPVIQIFSPPVSPFIEHILYHLDPANASGNLILRYQPDGTAAADYVQCKLYNLHPNTIYKWKVVAIDEKNATASSEWWTFKTGGQ